MTSYEYFYPGTPYSLEPNYGSKEGFFTGYRINAGEFGMTTDGRTANQLQEISNKLNSGIKVAEMSGSDATLLDSIPIQQFKEINRLNKLTGSEMTLHGPQIEASGITQQGWSELNREAAERQMGSAIERGHLMSPDGNIPVTFHSTSGLPEGMEKTKEKDKETGEWKEVSKSEIIVDPETGKLVGQLREKKRYFPGDPTKFNPEKELEIQNKEQWSNMLSHLVFNVNNGTNTIEAVTRQDKNRPSHFLIPYEVYTNIKSGKQKIEDSAPEPVIEEWKRQYKEMDQMVTHGEIYLKEGYRELKDNFTLAYKSALENKNSEDAEQRKRAAEDLKKLDEFKKITEEKQKSLNDPRILGEIVEDGLKTLSEINTPRILKPLNEFILDKSSTTFGNVAFKAWQDFGDKAPIISIENPPAGGGLSRAGDLKDLIEKSRQKFVDKAVEEGVSKSEAKDAAEKIIGATWDVGHINMMRKFGYDSADIIKETEKIAPLVKHVHLSDNFGMEHTELPMGMGNVPIKEMMEKLGKEGFSGKKIVEAFQWWQHMKTSPLVPTLEAFGSPLYPMLAQPGWNQAAGTYGSYFQFPSAYMPEQHFSLYGGGFSTLPTELGGQVPGKQNRLTGTPME